MTKYLTPRSLKARNNSFRSLGIISGVSLKSGSEGIGRFADIPNGTESISNGQTLPVAVHFYLLLLFGICDPGNGLICAHDARSRFTVFLSPEENPACLNSLYGLARARRQAQKC